VFFGTDFITVTKVSTSWFGVKQIIVRLLALEICLLLSFLQSYEDVRFHFVDTACFCVGHFVALLVGLCRKLLIYIYEILEGVCLRMGNR